MIVISVTRHSPDQVDCVFINNQSMKVLGMLVASVALNILKRIILKHTLSQNMKVS